MSEACGHAADRFGYKCKDCEGADKKRIAELEAKLEGAGLSALRDEMQKILLEAASMLGAERLAGNVVKQAFAQGEAIMAQKMLDALDSMAGKE